MLRSEEILPRSISQPHCWYELAGSGPPRGRRSIGGSSPSGGKGLPDPWAAAGGYFNFAERPCDADSILPAEACERLAEVKRRRDPQGTIVGAHPVAVEAAV